MPTKVEEKLRKEAEEKFPGDKPRQDRYIYGTMRHLGWKPEREKKKEDDDVGDHEYR
jgi:hypothetical protein